jgi:hypothetical protein
MRTISKIAVVLILASAVIGYSKEGVNGRRLLIIMGDAMSDANKFKYAKKAASFYGDATDGASLTNVWKMASRWRSKAKPSQTARMIDIDYDRLHAAGAKKKFQFEDDLIHKAYQWGTNHLGADVKNMQVVIADSAAWMTNDYTEIK